MGAEGMSEQLSLLDYPNHPGAKRNGTSREAAEAMAPRAATLRARAFEAICKHDGLTADQCAKLLKESVLAIRPRITELSAMGKITETIWRRRNASGRKAIVWICAGKHEL
jgi:predicted ArsR family transcriptional regulator